MLKKMKLKSKKTSQERWKDFISTFFRISPQKPVMSKIVDSDPKLGKYHKKRKIKNKIAKQSRKKNRGK
jgi:hypothetical protein